MYISQTFLQDPAAWQLSHNVLLLKMFIANYSWTCHSKAISSMLPLNEITPAISSLGARGEFEEMIATEEPFVIIIAVVTAKNGTMFTSFLWRRHNPIKYQRNDKNSEEKQGKASFVLINTPRVKIRLNASLDVVSARLLFQNGAGTVKKAITLKIAKMWGCFENAFVNDTSLDPRPLPSLHMRRCYSALSVVPILFTFTNVYKMALDSTMEPILRHISKLFKRRGCDWRNHSPDSPSFWTTSSRILLRG